MDRRTSKKRISGAVAVLIFAAALLFNGSIALAEVRIEGVPSWLAVPMERSASAVWSEIEQNVQLSGREEKLALLSVVAERLFSGYSVAGTDKSDQGAVLYMKPLHGEIPWEVELYPPQLVSPVLEWFLEAAQGIDRRIREAMRGIPVDSLTWADLPLKEMIESLCAPHLPGWTPSLLVRLEEGKRILRVSFSPKPPLVLAVVPKVSSSTLPVMLRSDLKENMLRTLAPVAGLPIEWAVSQRKRIESLAADSLRDTKIVGNARADVDVSFNPAQLAAASAEVESPKYSFRAWVAAYAGSDTKYPEIGLHMGRKFLPVSGLDMEFYGEWLLSANDFSLESRWGIRWSPMKNVLAGVEQAFPGNVTWYRLWLDGGVRAPYVWWRVSEDGDHNVGAGYRINDRISLEIHYDGRDEEKISIKAISDL